MFEFLEIDALDCRYAPIPWPFAATHAAEIDAHWARLTRANPKLFNGRVLLQYESRAEEAAGSRRFHGKYLETDFKNFISWRDFGHPEDGLRNCFAMAALQGADGAFVVGEMGDHTANAGRVYFPSGTPDPSDILGDVVDLEGSVTRELAEETGLGPPDVEFAPGWLLIADRARVACMKLARAQLSSEALVEKIHAFLARDPQPELARMHIIRGEADFHGLDMPGFMAPYLRRMLTRTQSAG